MNGVAMVDESKNFEEILSIDDIEKIEYPICSNSYVRPKINKVVEKKVEPLENDASQYK